jgi:hypothetical protein
MTLGDAKGATMLSKGPWVLDTLLGSIVNIGKVVKIIYGMTLGGGKEVTMLSKGPWVLGESRNKGTKQCVDNP